MSTTSSRLDPRVLRTRQLIRDAFIDLLQEVELEKISVNRIAERATINRVTFYLHYKDIQDMLEKMADDMIQEIKVILGEVSSRSAAMDKDGTVMSKVLEHIAANSKFYKVLLASKRIPVFTDRLTQLMLEVITARARHPELAPPAAALGVPVDIAVWYGSSAFIGTIVWWLRNDMPYTPQYLAKQLALLFRMHQNTTGP
ncbi:TetR/AcrR family transcriptional regulator [Paenibacillus sacheonensis]|uniref:TetR family transcriptional regulator n=1 Tax=Paenibacillus sacheonensis TaxID=742054 RepID=A0A7X5BWL5_9BACL|nr:TetR/AcrR family transcriptional regulator [Paenibacillus sacheonensis]MBM7564013.1 AcrR family transcriptional regulator [Paenibacillus sacheonensis]NBC67652.1 TetR family transcriptional regulator [Paenibacillus sacheonensis]